MVAELPASALVDLLWALAACGSPSPPLAAALAAALLGHPEAPLQDITWAQHQVSLPPPPSLSGPLSRSAVR